MNIMQSHSLINAGTYAPFPRPCSRKTIRQQNKFRIMSYSYKSTDENFEKQLPDFAGFKNASVDQIKKTYRKMALRYHPDVCDPSKKEESTRMFIELQKAYKSLLDQDSHKMSSLDNESNVKCWASQLSELDRRSQLRMEQREKGSWGCRMRASCKEPHRI